MGFAQSPFCLLLFHLTFWAEAWSPFHEIIFLLEIIHDSLNHLLKLMINDAETLILREQT